MLPEDWTPETGRHFTFFFNAFVFMQVFNEINCRKLLSTEYNVFAGFFNNPLFLLIILVTIVVQIILVTFGGQIFKCSQLTLVEHAYCLAIGAGGILWGLFIRALPNKCLSFMKFSEEPMNAMQVKTSVTGFIRKAVISRGITGALARK